MFFHYCIAVDFMNTPDNLLSRYKIDFVNFPKALNSVQGNQNVNLIIGYHKTFQPSATLDKCGLFLKVGLPGKSSKAGTMMMVLPNTMGISIYSPNIDQYGNSVRGLAFCEELVKVFNFHRYANNAK